MAGCRGRIWESTLLHVHLLLEIPRLTDLEGSCKFLSFSLGYDISLQRLNSHVHSLIVQRRMTLRMGIKEEEITFIKKFRFPPSFWSCARRTFMLMKCINKVLKLSRSSLAHVSELENFQTRQLQSQWVPLKRDDLRDGQPLIFKRHVAQLRAFTVKTHIKPFPARNVKEKCKSDLICAGSEESTVLVWYSLYL